MKIYYAHAICIYGTDYEKEEKKLIFDSFPNSEIVDPGAFENSLEKTIMGMDFCLNLVSQCDMVIFSRILGKITAGVGKEINHAISKNIPVFEIKENKLKEIKNRIKYVSREESRSLYDKWEKKYLN